MRGLPGSRPVLPMTLAEIALLLLFCLAVIVAAMGADRIELAQLRSHRALMRDSLEVLESFRDSVTQGRSNIPDRCPGPPFLEIVILGANAFCIDGRELTLRELRQQYQATQNAREATGDCKVPVVAYPGPDVTAPTVFAGFNRLAEQFWYIDRGVEVRFCAPQ